MYNENNSIILTSKNKTISGEVKLPSSKSICNRVLIIQSICNNYFSIANLSEADDSQLLAALLNEIHKPSNSNLAKIINTKNAGTVFRFLTAYLSVYKGHYVLTGDNRMLQRPVKSLVKSLSQLGADINYMEEKGFPPLLIGDLHYKSNDITVEANLSSQFVSALMLVTPLLPDGLKINIQSEIVSRPYIDMTLKIMSLFGVKSTWNDNIITIPKQDYIVVDDSYTIEPDWSAASYFYELVALSNTADLFIHNLSKTTLQGDAVVADIFKSFGVATSYETNGIRLTKNNTIVDEFSFDFSNYPDLVPAVAVTCAALGINAELKGLKNLKIKESDRLSALVIELNKMGVNTLVENDEVLWVDKSRMEIFEPVATYNDHRMAMCFAPLALHKGKVVLLNPNVVAKSFPNYFNELYTLGFNLNQEE